MGQHSVVTGEWTEKEGTGQIWEDMHSSLAETPAGAPALPAPSFCCFIPWLLAHQCPPVLVAAPVEPSASLEGTTVTPGSGSDTGSGLGSPEGLCIDELNVLGLSYSSPGGKVCFAEKHSR